MEEGGEGEVGDYGEDEGTLPASDAGGGGEADPQ